MSDMNTRLFSLVSLALICNAYVTPETCTSKPIAAWYDGDSFAGSTWTDKSGTVLAGEVTEATLYPGDGSVAELDLNGQSVVYGGPSATVTFNTNLPRTHTVFNLCKYRNNGTKGRIIDGAGCNCLFGHWNGLAGVAYEEAWLTPETSLTPNTEWVLSSQTNSQYRANGVQRSTQAGADTGSGIRLGIQTGIHPTQVSDWACAEILAYNQELDEKEISCVENYFSCKYGVSVDGHVCACDGECAGIESETCNTQTGNCQVLIPLNHASDIDLYVWGNAIFEGSAKWYDCPDGYVVNGFYKGGCQSLHCIENMRCVRPDTASIVSQECYQEDTRWTFDHEGTVQCREGYFVNGIYGNSNDGSCGLECWEYLKCCQYDPEVLLYSSEVYDQDWWACFDGTTSRWCEADNDRYITGFYRNHGHDLYNLELAKTREIFELRHVRDPLVCPDGTKQIGGDYADITGCGLDACENRYGIESIAACHSKCLLNPYCRSFTFGAPRPLTNGANDPAYPDREVCTLYNGDMSDGVNSKKQKMCALLGSEYERQLCYSANSATIGESLYDGIVSETAISNGIFFFDITNTSLTNANDYISLRLHAFKDIDYASFLEIAIYSGQVIVSRVNPEDNSKHELKTRIGLTPGLTPDPQCTVGHRDGNACFRSDCPVYGGADCSEDCCTGGINSRGIYCDINGPPSISCKLPTPDPQCTVGALKYGTYCFRRDCPVFGGPGCVNDCCQGRIDGSNIDCDINGPPSISCKLRNPLTVPPSKDYSFWVQFNAEPATDTGFIRFGIGSENTFENELLHFPFADFVDKGDTAKLRISYEAFKYIAAAYVPTDGSDRAVRMILYDSCKSEDELSAFVDSFGLLSNEKGVSGKVGINVYVKNSIYSCVIDQVKEGEKNLCTNLHYTKSERCTHDSFRQITHSYDYVMEISYFEDDYLVLDEFYLDDYAISVAETIFLTNKDGNNKVLVAFKDDEESVDIPVNIVGDIIDASTLSSSSDPSDLSFGVSIVTKKSTQILIELYGKSNRYSCNFIPSLIEGSTLSYSCVSNADHSELDESRDVYNYVSYAQVDCLPDAVDQNQLKIVIESEGDIEIGGVFINGVKFFTFCGDTNEALCSSNDEVSSYIGGTDYHMIVEGNSASLDVGELCMPDDEVSTSDIGGTDGDGTPWDDIAVQCCFEDSSGTVFGERDEDKDGNAVACLEGVSWLTAKGECENRNGRLCTVDEARNDVAAGTGCMHNERRVWTSYKCASCDRLINCIDIGIASSDKPQIKPIIVFNDIFDTAVSLNIDSYSNLFKLSITTCNTPQSSTGLSLLLKGVLGSSQREILTNLPSNNLNIYHIGSTAIGTFFSLQLEIDGDDSICLSQVVLTDAVTNKVLFETDESTIGKGVYLQRECAVPFKLLANNVFIPCYEQFFLLEAYNSRSYTKVTMELCAGDPNEVGLAKEEQTQLAIVLNGLDKNKAFLASDAIPLSSDQDWDTTTSTGSFREYNIIYDDFDIVSLSLVFINNDQTDAVCIDEVILNSQTAILTNFWIGAQGCADRPCSPSIPAVLSWPVCKTEIIGETVVLVEKEETDGDILANSCSNLNRFGSIECAASQSFSYSYSLTEESSVSHGQAKGVEIANSYSKGSSLERGSEITVSRGYEIGPDELKSTGSSQKSGSRSSGQSTERSRSSTTSKETTFERSETFVADKTTESSISCEGSMEVGPFQKVDYDIIKAVAMSTYQTMTDFKLTKCSYILDEDDNNPDHFIYLMGVPGKLDVSETTSCSVKFYETQFIQAGSMTCRQAQMIKGSEFDTYVPFCNPVNSKQWDPCQCETGDSKTDPTCYCVDPGTGLTTPAIKASAIDTGITSWKNWCAQNCEGTQFKPDQALVDINGKAITAASAIANPENRVDIIKESAYDNKNGDKWAPANNVINDDRNVVIGLDAQLTEQIKIYLNIFLLLFVLFCGAFLVMYGIKHFKTSGMESMDRAKYNKVAQFDVGSETETEQV